MTKKEDSAFDLDGLRIDPRDQKLVQKGDSRLAKGAKRGPRASLFPEAGKDRKRSFIKVPCEWEFRLSAATRAATYKVAMRLLWLHFRNGGSPTVLGNLVLRQAGISSKRKRYALSELERLGLVHVKRQARKSPIVTLVMDFDPPGSA